MSLRVIQKTVPTGMYMTIRIGSETRADLEGPQAAAFAKQACMQEGFNARGLSNTPQIYPVNEKGEASGAVAVGQEKLAWFESEYTFTTGL